MLKQVTIILILGSVVAGCGYSRNIPKSWRPETVEEQALKWAVKLCHQFGYQEETDERRTCIARRYDQYIMEHN
ncbi:MAG: hypothetical protein Tp1109DCM542121_20 [Prokaryotic dsDNA virus sp.]|nr:MAG: hypothetical protein Tp1109DCM542121_20 [Prokaryotic dsDNA virus sp.]|tara:strand:+ start:14141 stop:14362 length:222 start_codon:yes stop_codon:yes gene_type:complete